MKTELSNRSRQRATGAWQNLFAAFEAALRLLHPFMPFITEELWHQLPQRAGAKSIALERFPEERADWIDEQAESRMALLQEIIVAARNIRAEMKLDPRRKVAAEFAANDINLRELVRQNLDPVLRLATLSALHFSSERLAPAGGAVRST